MNYWPLPIASSLIENGEPAMRKFSDHKTVMSQFKLTPSNVKKIVQKPKFIKDEVSRAQKL